jgi:predicted ATPase
MQQWRSLALEPSAMRSPDIASDPGVIGADGAHMASTLFRISTRDNEDVFAQVASSSAALVDIRNVDVDYDMQRDLLTLRARIGDGPFLPARALSDGTLRFLALCIIASDPDYGGLLCMEEPENGIHPGRIKAMVELIRDLAVDPFELPSTSNPLRQVLVNTHSPFFVQYQDENDVLLALPTTISRENERCTTVRLVPLTNSWRHKAGAVNAVAKETIAEYLQQAPDAQLTLEPYFG